MSEGRFSGLSGVLAGTAAAITAVGGVVAILVQVGVIGGDESTTTPDPAITGSSILDQPTRADWAARANEICEKANDDIDALPEAEGLDLAQAASAGGEAVDIGQRQLRELQKLSPPEDDAPQVKRLLRIFAQQNDAAEELFGALRVGDITRMEPRIESLKRLGRSGDDLANRLGATTCAEGASFVGIDLGGG